MSGILALSLLLASGPARGGTTDMVPYSVDLSVRIADIVAEPEGRYLGVLSGTESARTVYVLDTWRWKFSAFSSASNDPCSGSAIKSVGTLSSSAWFFVGCGDGTVRALRPSDGLYTVGNFQSTALETPPLFLVEIGSELTALRTGSTGIVASSVNVNTGALGVERVSPAPSGPTAAAGGENAAMVVYGGNLVTGFYPSGSFPTIPPVAGQFSDVLGVSPGLFAFAAGPTGVVTHTLGGANILQGLGSGLFSDALALGRWQDELVVADDGTGELLFLPISAGAPQATVRARLALPSGGSGAQVTAIGGVEDYLVVGNSVGSLQIWTELPWVTVADPVPSSGVKGTDFTLSFRPPDGVEWRVRRSDGTLEGGELLDRGTADGSGEVTVGATLDSRFSEGNNLLVVEVEDDEGRVGHAGAYIRKDDPPNQVSIGPKDVRVEHESLSLVFDALSAPDIARYRLFISDAPFTAEDYVDCAGDEDGPCGPSGQFDGVARRVVVPYEDGASTVRATATGLTNGQTYYMAVRAYDESGQEGPMSQVVEGVPRPGKGPGELSGENGGLCGLARPSSGLLALGGLGLVLRRRRSAVGAAALGVALSASAAHAQDAEHLKTTGHVQVTYGNVELEDTAITDVYGTSGNGVTMLQWGPQLIKQIELTGGAGWFRENGKGLLDDGTRSDAKINFRAIPFTLDAKVRLDFFKDQVIVPAAGIGLDAWSFKQDPYKGDQVLTGWKYGWHWTAGGQLLLDKLDPRTASKVQAVTGVDNTWLVVEFRKQDIGSGDDGLIFTGQALNFGLQFDY